MREQNDPWYALTQEEPIEPDLPICDPHHHLWDRPNHRYLRDELVADTGSGHTIVRTVFVECQSMYRTDGPDALRPVGETEFVQKVADQMAGDGEGLIAGIVSFADLTLGANVDEVLEAHLAASPDRFRGIRHATAWEPDTPTYRNSPPRLMEDGAFRAGFARLHVYDLSYDAWLYHPQLLELVDLAQAFADTTIVLNHIGGLRGTGIFAGKRDTVYEVWKKGIAALAACPNVVCKVGGIGMPAYGFGWQEREQPPGSAEIAEAMAPYYLYCIEQFGVNRCMFESNFPVDNASYSYGVMWNAYKRLTDGFSSGERAALFHNTAAGVYRL